MSKRTPRELIGDTKKAIEILQLFTDPRKGRDVKMLIPPSVLQNAHGIVFIRLYRIGFMLSAKTGTGVIIARLPDGSWSAPSGVSMSSIGFGHQAGGEVIDSIIVMNYRAAVKAFFDGGGQLQLGVGASLAVGPLGREANVSASAANTSHIAATYAYSASKGLYIGYSFEGSKISERVNTNEAYYGRPITAREILTGVVPPTQDAARLYDMLNSLGAGPRPGLPFAPQKSGSNISINTPQPPPVVPVQQPQRPTPPSVNYTNRPHTTADGFEEPPPPYQSHDATNKAPPTSPPLDTNTPPFNEAYMNNNNYPTDTKAPFNNTSSFNRGAINSAAVEIQRTGSHHQPQNPYFNAPSSSSSAAATRPVASTSSIAAPAPTQQDKKKPMNEPEQSMTVVIAKFDYHSDAPSDLSFSAGDTIIVTKRLDDRQAWWEGEIGTKRGFFPANYTEELE